MPKTKSKFVIQRWDDDHWIDTKEEDIQDTADGARRIKEKGLEGEFRIISVRAYASSTKKTTIDVDVRGVDTDDD